MTLGFGRLPIFWQTLCLILATLLASFAVNIFLVMAAPQPRLDFYSLRDLAEALGDPRGLLRGRYADPALTVSTGSTPPIPNERGMQTHEQISWHLANRLNVPVSRVRLFYQADQTNFPFRYRQTDAGVPIRLGEPQFYNTVVAAVQQEDGRWRTVRTPGRPAITRYPRRLIYTFLLSLIVVLPIAYLFARQLANPVKRFVEAAERAGDSDTAPAVPLEGSIEMRNAAHSVNAMQRRVSDMLSERTAMMGAIAHDLRTPLARIAFRIEGAPEGVRSAVIDDITQMRAMIAATMAFVKGGRLPLTDLRRVELSRTVGAAVANAQAMGHDLNFSAQEAWMVGDEIALGRLFQNVIDNALTYAGCAEVSVEVEDDRIVAAVRDRGPGIPEHMIEESFKPFSRGDPSRNRSTGGVGLGLSIARSIALAHGGTLHAENRRDGGLAMVATFPTLASSAQASTEPRGQFLLEAAE